MSEAAAPRRTWALKTAHGFVMHVPDRLSSRSAYVLLEQERWCTPEIDFLPRLLAADGLVLDIGAGHGPFALALATHLRSGHTWAFEPRAALRDTLVQGIAANKLEARITVLPFGLGDACRPGVWPLDPDDAGGPAGAGATTFERIQLDTLDAFAGRHLAGRHVDLVRIGACESMAAVLRGGERFFRDEAPVVMFEWPPEARVSGVVAAFGMPGTALYRYLPELELLGPLQSDDDAPPPGSAVFAVPAPQAERLARARLLVTASAFAQAIDTSPPGDGSRDAAPAPYVDALQLTIAGHTERDRTPAERMNSLWRARQGLQAALDAGDEAGPEAWALLVHLLHALGQTPAALEIAGELVRQWDPALPISRPVMPPQRADLDLARTQPDADWLRLRLAEFIAMRSADSSYGAEPDLPNLRRIVAQPDHRPEMARRLVLAAMRRDEPPPVDRIEAIARHADTLNADLWQAVAREFARPAPADPAPDTAMPLLQALQPRPIEVVDVGASRLGDEREPYAALVRHGAAHVTGFEPDAGALAELRQAHPPPSPHRFLPHFVGRGGAAVFHETPWFMTASLLPPNEPLLEKFDGMLPLSRTVATHPVVTARLDDVIEPGRMDLLKIDVQGAESQVFEGAAARLRECLMVWTEVEFVPLYRDQPLFGDVDRALRSHGLEFHSFVGMGQRHLADWAALPSARRGGRKQMLWADAVYLPSLDRREALDDGSLARLALLAHSVLAAHDVCHAALAELDRRHGTRHAAAYAEAQRVAAPPAR